MRLHSTTIPSPVGTLTLVAHDDGLVAVLWEGDRPGRVRLDEAVVTPDHPILVHAARELAEYFSSTRHAFTVPLAPEGTAFQHAVWQALRAIPHGETRSYAQIAHAIGRPAAVRAVGAANGRNPISIIVPCHRVIGSNGALTGFAGGLAAKEALLALERGERRLL